MEWLHCVFIHNRFRCFCYVKFSSIIINIFYIVLDALILLRNITKHVCMAHGMKCAPQQCPRLLYDFRVYIDYMLSLKSYVSYLVDNLFYRMMLVSFSYSILEEGVHDYHRSFWCIHTWSFTFSSKSASCASSSIKFSSTIGTMMSAIFRLIGGFSHNFWENTLNDDEIWVSWISWMELEATKGSERQWTDRLMCIFVYIYTKSHDIYLNSHIKFMCFSMKCHVPIVKKDSGFID